MIIKRRRTWEISEAAVTPEAIYRQRRQFVANAAAGCMVALGGGLLAACGDAALPASAGADEPESGPEDPSAGLYPFPRNEAYAVARAVTEEKLATTFNNFYEFGSSKTVWPSAVGMELRPWTVSIGGAVEKAQQVAFEDLLARMPLEERVYRLRCVEAWSMVVPWSGFQLSHLVELARPLSRARYLRLTTAEQPQVMRGLRASWYPWPYQEGLTMAEAMHELAFMVTGIYGRPLPPQNGAPLRLPLPWKYGFKSIKSIVALDFVEERPRSFWQSVAGNEYGFWANVNPQVAHPRWSQAREQVLGTGETVPTRLYNGYAAEVAGLYAGMDAKTEKLFM